MLLKKKQKKLTAIYLQGFLSRKRIPFIYVNNVITKWMSSFISTQIVVYFRAGLLNWVLIERRSIQLFSSMNWTELNEIKIWTLNAEQQNPKNKLSSSSILFSKKNSQNGKKSETFH